MEVSDQGMSSQKNHTPVVAANVNTEVEKIDQEKEVVEKEEVKNEEVKNEEVTTQV